MPAVDNPTKGYATWRAGRGYPDDDRARSAYQTYQRVNDAALSQRGIYSGAWAADDPARAALNASYGGRLTTALGASVLIVDRVNWLAGKGYGAEREHDTALQLGDGTWFSEQAKWSQWWTAYRAAESNKKKKAETRKAWEAIATPLIVAYNKEQGTSFAGTYAKIVERAPLFSRGIRDMIAARGKPSAGLTEQIRSTLGLGEGRRVAPAAGAAGASGGGKPLPWGSIVVGVIVLLALGVGAFFIFRDE